MTQDYQTGLPSDAESSTTQTAKDEAANVAHSAKESGTYLAGEAKTQAAQVGREVGRQAKGILTEAGTQVTEQASNQQHRMAGQIRSFGQELSTMADASEHPGLASQVTRQVADSAQTVATWFDDREPADILAEVKTFARNRPGTFLLIAVGAGLVVGRLTSGLRAGTASSAANGSAPAHRAPGAASTGSAGHGLGSQSAEAPVRTSAYQTVGAGAGAGSTYGSPGSSQDYGTPAGGATYGLETGTEGHGAPTTHGSSEETLAFTTASPSAGDQPDTYGTGTENPPADALGYPSDADTSGTFGGGTSEVPEREGEGDLR